MSARRRVAIVGTVGLPPRYGGFETLAHFLVLYLGEEFDFTVYCSGPDYAERPKSYLGAKLRYLPFRANGAQSVLFDMASLALSCLHGEDVLLLGVSGAIFLPIVRLFGRKVVLNIGGLDWQRAKWGRFASRFLRMSEAIAVRCSQMVIADNEGIAGYLAAEYGRESFLIEYGGDQIGAVAITDDWRKKYPFLNAAYAFSVARIQADNNIEMVLEAFARAPGQVFVMVGNWGSSEFGRELKARFAGYANLHLLDAIYALEELNVLRGHCSVYVHGHSAGGTNPSLVEAMHLSLPIAAFDVVYNRATTEGSARYFKDAEELAGMVASLPQAEWDSQRAVMQEIAQRRYRWQTITEKYARLLGPGHPPLPPPF